MESQNLSCDYLSEYRAISSKMKKRFLRKPNIAEASEDYSKLAQRLSDGEAYPQAGFCYLAVAKCEQTLANKVCEVAARKEAALNFLKAEQLSKHLNCHTYEEHLTTAMQCSDECMKLYQEDGKTALAASVAMELSQALCSLEKYSEALRYLTKASELLCDSPVDNITCLNMIASCKIELGDLDGALIMFKDVTSIIKKFEKPYLSSDFKDTLTRCEICSLLILLILRPNPSQIKLEHSQLLEKYSSNPESENSSFPYDNKEMVVLLQSLAIACQTHDISSFDSLSVHLSHKLGGQPLHLLHILSIEMRRT